ncbi:ectoine/hydroxyectoine ABC transporter permease subunit EhuC [Haloechinothrix sp. YIM 98757]|uniref:Ectoine/hydroxyectoine ABC transporter permease subunit EhuC n=1 Tax=Haloechinothrix aidingensis TaxID=2752311 RepID=A0A838AEJ3_9PSEU|nr:ectoine/hydroxyectoine ABC transporter permease subunit EhuC [Haloechinothrix aidingensis]
MSTIIEHAPRLWEGLLVTLQLLVLGSVLTLVIAFTAGLARMSRQFLVRFPAAVFIEVFRGTSMIVQLFWFFFALPMLGIELPGFAVGVLVLALNEGAYAAEVVRGAIKSRPAGQTEACIALGIGPVTRMRRILIPQSIPAMLPAFGNVVVDLLKNTSLVSAVTVLDLTYQGQTIRAITGETTAVFTTLLIVYFVLSVLLSFLVKWSERHFAIDRVGKSNGARLLSLPGISRGGTT